MKYFFTNSETPSNQSTFKKALAIIGILLATMTTMQGQLSAMESNEQELKKQKKMDKTEYALLLAAYRNNMDEVTSIVTNNPQLNINVTSKGKSALYYAKKNQNNEMIQFLIEHGAKDQTTIKQKNSSTHEQESTEVKKQQTTSTTDSNVQEPPATSTNKIEPTWDDIQLVYATMQGHKPTIEKLIRKGANPYIKSESNQTLIEWAQQYQRYDLVELIEKTYQEVHPVTT